MQSQGKRYVVIAISYFLLNGGGGKNIFYSAAEYDQVTKQIHFRNLCTYFPEN
jgi:hypothetical protein